MEFTERTLFPGVRLRAVQTRKFKSSVLSLTMLTPLDHETAAANALIPSVLRRGTANCPDMESLSAALDELYGGAIEGSVRKKGETQCVGFVASFLDDAYTPDGSAILEPAAMLLGDLLLRPATENGRFRTDYVDGERENLIDRIKAQKNEKRQYSVTRLIEQMCRDERYGVSRLGSEETARAITAESLWDSYQTLLARSEVQVYYCGSADPDRVEKALKEALTGLPRAGEEWEAATGCQVRAHTGGAVREFTDRMDVAQGKLSMGFRTGGVNARSDDHAALLVFNALYGGSSNSKLFLNVREKLSLCYYAGSMIERLKGIMIVSSGVEFANFGKARDEILAQLKACQAGEIDQAELEAARRYVMNDLRSTADSQGQLEDHWLAQAVAGTDWPTEELAAQVAEVTMEDVVRVARGMELDSIYYLTGKEA